MSLASGLRLRLLDKYIIRELVPPIGIGLFLFSFVLLLQHITVLAGVLISRGADVPTTIRLFFNLLPSIFAITIPMAFLLGVLLAFGRLVSESEVVAMRASGISPLQMLRPVLLLSLAAAGVTFYIMTVPLPHANTAYRELFYTLVVGNARTEIKPRIFNDDRLPGMVLYISDVDSATGDWKDVFISDTRVPARPKVMLARRGRLVIDDAAKSVMLQLEHGYMHAYDAVKPKEYVQEYFKSGEFYLPFEQMFPKIPLLKGDREMTIPELQSKVAQLEAKGKGLDAASFRVELHKKFAIPGACFVFGLLGVGLSLGKQKEARSAAFALSIGVISLYYVILRLGEQAGDTGMLSPFVGMWGANILLGVIGVALIVLNQREAAFDPLSLSHYTFWIPRIRRRARLANEPVARPVTGAPAAARSGLLIRILRGRPGGARRFGFLPTLLDSYIARQYIAYAVLIVAGFSAIFLLSHFMELLDEVRENRIKGAVVLHFYTFYFPEIIYLTIPVAMLVATLTTFGVLSRRNEITAIKAGGISVYRATIPVLAMGALSSILLFVMGEFLLPHTNKVAGKDENIIRGRPPQSVSYLERRWILGSDGRIYNYDYMSQGGPAVKRTGAPTTPDRDVSLYGLSVFELDTENWNVGERLYAGRARWNPSGYYDLEQGWRWSFRRGSAQFRPFSTVRTREVEDPSYFKREERASDEMRFMELRAHIASLEQLGVDVARLKMQLQQKLTYPLVAFIMTLIGIRYSFVVGRRGALYGVGVSIAIGVVFFVAVRLFEQMGNNAILPPQLAAWAPNILFAAASLYLMLTLET